MNLSITNKINEKLNQIQADRKTLVVLKGFSAEALAGIRLQKLFDAPLPQYLLNLEEQKQQLMISAVTKLTSEDPVFWCTYEELIAVSRAALENLFEIKVYFNNMFYHYYPLLYTIEDINGIYEKYFEDLEDHPDIPEEVRLLTKYYGNISRLDNGNYYVSYTEKEEDEDGIFDAAPLSPSFPLMEDGTHYLELSDDESAFLTYLDSLKSSVDKPEPLVITWKGELNQFAHRYPERLAVLKTLVPGLKIFRLKQTLASETIAKEKDYLAILKRYWGYDSFRNLKMYENVDDVENPKALANISQSQIINDLVLQAEAAMNDKDFRDIFVTSSTGAGKSLMFQIPAVYLAEKYGLMTIVISPLIGLMKDQVYSLQDKDVTFSATINSEISPVEKMNITNKIQNGEISILYISPETLLSRSDIRMLIGERKIGLFVIDEAHIVTTWGKSFRSDYWYLGNYLQKLRKTQKERTNHSFPIATFTATAIYGGVEDMYSETRDSLYMVNPINYFGYVKRDDIKVSLKKIDKKVSRDSEYLAVKFTLLHERIKRKVKKGKKVLVYFPFVRFIREFRNYLERHGEPDLVKTVASYYGSMKKEEKNESFLKFKTGDCLVMLATKAFGMGIDIADIETVIHFAPTGNVADFIQEIGRAARDEEMTGHAYFDFLNKDFNHVKRLHGISTIKKGQLIRVMDKILAIYSREKNKKFARNLLINSEDFRYIFDRSRNSDFDADELDNKLKTALLIIEKDFINKLGYSPIVARPRSVFSVEFVKVKKDVELDFGSEYRRYVKKISSIKDNYYGGIYRFDLKSLWEERYKDLSFPQFKFFFHQKDDKLKLPYIEFIESVLVIQMDLGDRSRNVFFGELHAFADRLQNVLGTFIRSEKYFTLADFAKETAEAFGKSKYQAESLANQILNSLISYQDTMRKSRTQRINVITVRDLGEDSKFKLSAGTNDFVRFLVAHTEKLLKLAAKMDMANQFELYLSKANRLEVEKTFVALGLMEAMDYLLYEVKGGDNPEIFIRVNSQLQLEKAVHDAEHYENSILSNVYQRHRISVAMLTYLFENEAGSDEFWNYIEDYFLGIIPPEVWEKLRADW